MRNPLYILRGDESLMLAYQRGDVTAFDELYLRHKDGLYGFLYRSCPRPAVVEELAQDAWMAVVDRAGPTDPTPASRTWLYGIARNRQIDYWRRRDNHHLPLDGIEENAATDSRSGGIDRILAAVGRLPSDQQDALLLQAQGFT